jgi:putative protease
MIEGEEKKLVGKISHYYGKIGVAVVEVEDDINVGDTISIEGAATNLRQTIDSMQVEHKNIKKAKKGESIGLKVTDKVRESDNVYKIISG